MKHRQQSINTIVLGILYGGSVLLLQPQLLRTQTFLSNPFSIAVQGHESEACDPRAGDEINMERCSLKVRVVRRGGESASILLPWETVSVKDAVAIDKGIVLFMGSTQAGFSQMTVYSETSRSIIHKQLAQSASLSPKHDFIAYQTYQPPHASQKPQVRIELVSTRAPAFDREWESRVIYETGSNSRSDAGSAEQGTSLCTSDLFWSQSEGRVGFCTLNNESGSEQLVLAPAHAGGDPTLFKEIDTGAICRATSQSPNERCTVFVESMGIGAANVDVQLRSVGSSGYKQQQLSYPIESFSRVPQATVPGVGMP